ncbi:MAG: glycine zipper 2TM domain-containing protein [Gammaproteobacteria bacterium]|nr:glycine zipper 2TM domain-containing protein [Gammaproteobacteria bacterium]
MNRQTLTAALLMTSLALATAAHADEGRYQGYDSDAFKDYAEVIDVQPIRTTLRVATPRRECWDEEVEYRHRGYGHGYSHTPMILGGILGGVAGHQFGKGDGNTLMTIAGALLGGSVGHDHARYYGDRRHYGSYSTVVETRCSVRTEYHDEERIDGYRVTYRYGGRTYTSRMDHHPGDRVRVDVRVTPAP